MREFDTKILRASALSSSSSAAAGSGNGKKRKAEDQGSGSPPKKARKTASAVNSEQSHRVKIRTAVVALQADSDLASKDEVCLPFLGSARLACVLNFGVCVCRSKF